jgi:hypothetical protein
MVTGLVVATNAHTPTDTTVINITPRMRHLLEIRAEGNHIEEF